MSALIPFEFDGRAIRVITDDDGSLHFVAMDVAETLDYSWQSNVIGSVPSDWKGVKRINTPGGMQSVSTLTEQGLYFFLGRSDKPKALPFQRWMAGDVLPSIRKTGSYSAPSAVAQTDLGLSMFQRAQALDTATNVADRICARFPKLGEEAQQVIFAKIVNPIAGDDVIPLPRLESKTFSAGEAGKLLGISGNKVGRLANEHGLKTSEFGVFVLDKSASSTKQVSSFLYNEAGVERLRQIVQPKDDGDLLGGAQ